MIMCGTLIHIVPVNYEYTTWVRGEGRVRERGKGNAEDAKRIWSAIIDICLVHSKLPAFNQSVAPIYQPGSVVIVNVHN
jgi:hypothetical protein